VPPGAAGQQCKALCARDHESTDDLCDGSDQQRRPTTDPIGEPSGRHFQHDRCEVVDAFQQQHFLERDARLEVEGEHRQPEQQVAAPS